MNPQRIEAIMDHVLDIFVERTRCIVEKIGAQNGPLFPPMTYRQLLKPCLKKLFETVKKGNDLEILHYTCEPVIKFIGDLAEIGVDILNPVQTSLAGIDLKILKSRFGDKVCFLEGIDTQNVLTFGTPDQVREEVRRCIDIFAPGRGYVAAAI